MVLIMENPQRKRLWIRKWLARRNTHGASNMFLKELATEDIEEYKNCMGIENVYTGLVHWRARVGITTCSSK
jgi:hypothetical protein